MTIADHVKRWLAERAVDLGARLLLSLPFVLSGFGKILDFNAAIGEQQHFGMPLPAVFAALTIIVQLGGSFLLFVDRWAWLGAGLLAGFTLFATLVAHRFWEFTDPLQRFQQANIFWEHAAICGGLIMLAIFAVRREREMAR